MSFRQICFVTGNCNKWNEARSILPQSIDLTRRSVDLVEIQGSRHEIAAHKCRQAAALVGGPVITEDTSLGFNALDDLPGPYVKHFLEALGPQGLYSLLQAHDDKSGNAYCTLAYLDPACMAEPMIFEGKAEGTIVPARGPANFGWDPIFQPSEHPSNLTFAEMSREQKNSVSHRHKALSKLSEYLDEHGVSGRK